MAQEKNIWKYNDNEWKVHISKKEVCDKLTEKFKLTTSTVYYETGVLSKEGAEKMRKFTGALQAMAGPMEVAIALKKLHIAITGVDTTTTKASTVATKKHAFHVRALNMAYKAMPLMLIIVGAILLHKVLVRLEEKTQFMTIAINKSTEAFNAFKDSVIGAGEAVSDFLDNVADVVTGDFTPIGRLLD